MASPSLAQTYTGRVKDVLETRDGAVPYYSSTHVGQVNMQHDVKNIDASNLADLFFSKMNMDALQQGIRWRVFSESGGKHTISRQSDTEIHIIMRSIYLQEGRNDPVDIVAQVRELNGKVLDFCVPRILEEIRMYTQFQHDISAMPVPMPRGEIASQKGSRVLNLMPMS